MIFHCGLVSVRYVPGAILTRSHNAERAGRLLKNAGTMGPAEQARAKLPTPGLPFHNRPA